MWDIFEPELSQRLADLEEEASFTRRAQAVLLEGLPSGQFSMDEVARRLGVSTRTLQRRLQVEGTRFKTVVGNTRRRLACHYLREHRPQQRAAGSRRASACRSGHSRGALLLRHGAGDFSGPSVPDPARSRFNCRSSPADRAGKCYAGRVTRDMFITLAVPSTARIGKTSRSSGQTERDQEARRGATSMSLNLQPGSVLGELGFDYESRAIPLATRIAESRSV